MNNYTVAITTNIYHMSGRGTKGQKHKIKTQYNIEIIMRGLILSHHNDWTTHDMR
jgi:hypothetical protein